MGAFDDARRNLRETVHQALSDLVALAIATGAGFVLAAVCLGLAPFFAVHHPGVAWDVLAFLARWALGLCLLSLAVGLLVHPHRRHLSPCPGSVSAR